MQIPFEKADSFKDSITIIVLKDAQVSEGQIHVPLKMDFFFREQLQSQLYSECSDHDLRVSMFRNNILVHPGARNYH